MINDPYLIQSRNPHLDEILNGKTVAIMGHGRSQKVCCGAFIDTHDVVVRMHVPCDISNAEWSPPPFIPNEWQPYIGKRTDIFFHNFNINVRYLCAVSRTWNAFEAEGGKLWCVDWANFGLERHWDCHKAIDREITYVQKPDMNVVFWLYDKLGGKPLSGTEIIVNILRSSVKSAFIAGVTCFMESGVPCTSYGLDSARDFEFLRKLWETHENLTVDPVMEKLFEKKEVA